MADLHRADNDLDEWMQAMHLSDYTASPSDSPAAPDGMPPVIERDAVGRCLLAGDYNDLHIW